MSNREELTRQAEKSLRQGRVEDAITLYQELADLTPIDWGIVKQLADLFERAGQREAASRQFCRWADHLFAEGFHSKAAALYKKVLKLDTSHEHALWQLGEVSLELKLRADARLAFQKVLELRQRRNDAAGTALARERLLSLDAAPPPARAGLSALGLTPVPSSAPEPERAVTAAATPPAVAPAVAPAPVPPPAPVAPVATSTPAPPPAPVVPPPPPPETPEARLARLRREAEEAEVARTPDVEGRWLAVLDADPHDVATRLRVVQRAMDRADFDEADRRALPLDASETPALVMLVELAWRRGAPDALARVIAARVHAGASPGHVLAPVEALAPRLTGAARASLAAAVAAWHAAGQPGHAVAALELANRSGLLDIDLHLRWVEICVDAGLAGLSRAQQALARAYVGAGRVAEARAVAEDVFVREGGSEPYRGLLLDVLDRLGEPDPHRVVVNLLTPPSEVVEESPAEPEVTRETVEIDLDLAMSSVDASAASLVDVPIVSALDVLLPTSLDAGPAVEADALDVEALALETPGPEPALVPLPAVADVGAWTPSPFVETIVAPETASSPVVTPEPAGEASPSASSGGFDWAFLLGRDVDAPWGAPSPIEPVAVTDTPAPALVDAEEPSLEVSHVADDAPVPVAADAAPPVEPTAIESLDPPLVDLSPLVDVQPEVAAAVVAPAIDEVPETVAEPARVVVETREESVMPSPAPSLGAPDHDPYEVRTPVDPVLAKIAAAQPIMAEPQEILPPTFNIPTSWFSDAPSDASRPRQRRPEDAYLFEDDDQVPSRWAPRPRPAPVSVTPPPAPSSAPASSADVSEPELSATPEIAPVPEPAEISTSSGLQDTLEDVVSAVVADPAPAPAAEFDTLETSTFAGEPPAVVEVEGGDAGAPGPVEEPAAAPADAPLPPVDATPDVIEEEVDLTQLLEELKQFDTVLPDPRPRSTPQASAEPSAAAAPVAAPVDVSSAVDDAAPDVPSAAAVSESPRPSLADLLRPPPGAPVETASALPAVIGPDEGTTELEAVFADMQRHTDDRMIAEQQLAAGRVFLAAGLVAEAARAFERAAQAPRSRFAAAQALAELHRSRGQVQEAVSWYEQAAAAPVPDAAVKRPVLYDLAESLEAIGETDRALGVLLDLLSQVEDYRDARARLDRLLRVDAGG